MTTKLVLITSILALAVAACSESAAPPASNSSEPAVQGGDSVPVEEAGVLPPVPVDGAIEASPATIAANAPEGGACALDVVNGKPRKPTMSLAAGGALLIGGWASTPELTPPVGALLLLRGGSASYTAPVSVEVARPDVARAKKSEALATSGFNAKVSTAGIPAGVYHLAIVVDSATSTWCDFNLELSLL